MKKRLFSILLCMVLALGLVACGNSDTSQTNAQENDEKKEQDTSEVTEPKGADELKSEAEQASDGKALVVYFFRIGNRQRRGYEHRGRKQYSCN